MWFHRVPRCLVLLASSLLLLSPMPSASLALNITSFNVTRLQQDISFAQTAAQDTTNQSFIAWAQQFNKTYLSATFNATEFTQRLSLFTANAKNVSAFNAANADPNDATIAWQRLTPFADLTAAEFKQLYCGTHGTVNTSAVVPTARHSNSRSLMQLQQQSSSAPTYLDWRAYNGQSYVTAVKNQGQCNDCWAFATTASVETSASVPPNTNPVVSLSEQQVLNCATVTSQYGGCTNGNTLPNGFTYWATPTTTYAQLPYLATYNANQGCSPASPPTLTSITSSKSVRSGSVSSLQNAVAQTASAVAICASTLQLYGGGILTSSSGLCQYCQQVDHAVTVVGYNATAGVPSTSSYWVVKNSWGTDWGDDGYLYFAMDSSYWGPCQVLQEPVYVPPSSVSVTGTSTPTPTTPSSSSSTSPSGSSTSQTTAPTPAPAASPTPTPTAAPAPPRFGALLAAALAAVALTLPAFL